MGFSSPLSCIHLKFKFDWSSSLIYSPCESFLYLDSPINIYFPAISYFQYCVTFVLSEQKSRTPTSFDACMEYFTVILYYFTFPLLLNFMHLRYDEDQQIDPYGLV